jgi:hypothetical protein
MQLKKLLFLLTLVSFTHFSFGQDLKQPVDYLTHISEEYTKIAKDQWSYTKAVGHGRGSRKVEKRRLEVVQSILEAKRKIARMPAFDGKTTFRDSVVAYMDISYHLMKEDYAKIVDMEEVAEESYDQMEAYLLAKKRAGEKSSDASKIVTRQKNIFAEDNNINLIESQSKLGEKLEKSSEVFDYYNKVYLIFFKSYKQDIYLSDAFNNQDINAIEQSRSALHNYSLEGREKLKTVTSYSGDQSIYVSARQLLQFYSIKAEKKVPLQVDYFLKKDQFEKIKSAFDKIKASKRTQSDVDKYNNAIEELNAASDLYNEINEQLYAQKAKLLKNWNNKVDAFLDRHIP